jgi:GNAT superfamily N-acetyltransferase
MTSRATIRRVATDEDLVALVRITNAVTPDDPSSLEELRWADATYPGSARFLASVDDKVVGAATVGRIYVHPPDYPDLWASLLVDPAARRRGIGSALLAAIGDETRRAGKTGLQLRAWVHRPDGIDFLVHRGFVELERARMVRLELAGLAPPVVAPPPGIRFTTLAEWPDLVVGVHDVALEAFDDIPGGDEPMAAGDLAEFRARDVDRPGIPPEAFVVALDEASGDVVGYASLLFVPGSTTVAWHDMTAVRRAWRGRGLATTLKQATIAWAIANGLEALETGNDEDNAAMRAVNLRLGYAPLPDELTMRGPLPPAASGPAAEAAS